MATQPPRSATEPTVAYQYVAYDGIRFNVLLYFDARHCNGSIKWVEGKTLSYIKTRSQWVELVSTFQFLTLFRITGRCKGSTQTRLSRVLFPII